MTWPYPSHLQLGNQDNEQLQYQLTRGAFKKQKLIYIKVL